tara:strand:+ start:3104 stop:3568 length:465 start_codon:yes stop_codon:yes gene_type:complete
MANLNVTVTEELTLNGSDRGSTNTLSIASVTQVYHRIVTCPTGVDTTVATFQTATSTSDNALDLEDVKYIRVTNLSASDVKLSLQAAGSEDGSANMSTSLLLSAGMTFIMGAPHDGIAMDDDAATLVTALIDLESLIINGHASANASIEVFIAS